MIIIALTNFRYRGDPVRPGNVIEVDDLFGHNIVALGGAAEATLKAPVAAPVDIPGVNPSESENAPQVPFDGEEIQGTDLEDMSFAELKQLAKDLGLEVGKIKSKAGMIEAISAVAEEGIPADDLPDLSAQDVVEE